ncbi:AbrB/MazE/SpoVT family DNA-binding domain-containing protein [Methylobacterium sp. sgz302541]|uniref:AbrB/MazE/SpoVT family DNA-binding domain-containing protein n=1 Tax=unclassified Methylobacterium TaxID=2615210 RepID=UPI003D34DB0D
MEAKVVRWGEDLAVRLSAEEARALGLSEGQTVEVVPRPSRLTLADMIAEMDRLGPANRPALIDWGPDVGAEIIRDDYS